MRTKYFWMGMDYLNETLKQRKSNCIKMSPAHYSSCRTKGGLLVRSYFSLAWNPPGIRLILEPPSFSQDVFCIFLYTWNLITILCFVCILFSVEDLHNAGPVLSSCGLYQNYYWFRGNFLQDTVCIQMNLNSLNFLGHERKSELLETYNWRKIRNIFFLCLS